MHVQWKMQSCTTLFSNTADGAQQLFLSSRQDSSTWSWIDLLFSVKALTVRSTKDKTVFFSNHCFLQADCHWQEDQKAGEGNMEDEPSNYWPQWAWRNYRGIREDWRIGRNYSGARVKNDLKTGVRIIKLGSNWTSWIARKGTQAEWNNASSPMVSGV